MLRIGVYGGGLLISFFLLRSGFIHSPLSPGRLASIYISVALPAAAAASLALLTVSFATLWVARRISLSHIRWYFLDGWIAGTLLLALSVSLSTIPARGWIEHRSVAWAVSRVEKSISRETPMEARGRAMLLIEDFWTHRFLPALASEDPRIWDDARDEIEGWMDAMQEGLTATEIDDLGRRARVGTPAY